MQISKLLLPLLFLNILACKDKNKVGETQMVEMTTKSATISKDSFGINKEGALIEQYTLDNGNGTEMKVISYGGIIRQLSFADKNGIVENVVLGFDNIGDYENGSPYFGALIGRYGNRIAKGKFTLDGNQYQLPTNDGVNHLHGGNKGFDKVVWTVKEQSADNDGAKLVLTYKSADMEMGYPGNLDVTVTYLLTKDNSLDILYEAVTDKKTVVNLTQHSYFNLSGDFTKEILDHLLLMTADKYIPVDNTLIPTGELADVTGTPFDFREAKSIGRDINAKNDQLAKGKGYDHCWVLNGTGLRSAATVTDTLSGRSMEILTDEPGLQFYTGNFLDGKLPMPGGGTYGHRTGFCLETQHYPDSPNQPKFPSVVLEPGAKYVSKTIFKFSHN